EGGGDPLGVDIDVGVWVGGVPLHGEGELRVGVPAAEGVGVAVLGNIGVGHIVAVKPRRRQLLLQGHVLQVVEGDHVGVFSVVLVIGDGVVVVGIIEVDLRADVAAV